MIDLVYYPDWGVGNPYLKLLYSKFDHTRFRLLSNNLDKALSISDKGNSTVFHQHWLNSILKNCANEEEAWKAVGDYINKLSQFQANGGCLVWTVHNAYSHECHFPEQEFRLRTYLFAKSDYVHLHHPCHIRFISDYINDQYSKIVISNHGNYIGAYGNFDLDSRIKSIDKGIKIAFVGHLRKYKSLDNILLIINYLADAGYPTMLAGKPFDDEIKKYIESKLSKKSQRILKFLSYPEMHQICTEFNTGLLSYDHVLTSGTLHLYMSYGMNILINSIPELEYEDILGTFYKYDINEPKKYLADFIKTPSSKLKLSAINNFLLAQKNCWSDNLAHKLLEHFAKERVFTN